MAVYAARSPASQIVLDPSGRYLAVSGILTGAEVWDLRRDSPKPITTIRPDWIGINIAFDPSGRYLLTAGSDGIILIWEGWEHGVPQSIVRHKLSKGVKRAAFSRDGKSIVALTEERQTMLLRSPWRPEDLVRIACTQIRETFTPREWQFVVPGTPYSPPCASYAKVWATSSPAIPSQTVQPQARPFAATMGEITGFAINDVKRLLSASLDPEKDFAPPVHGISIAGRIHIIGGNDDPFSPTNADAQLAPSELAIFVVDELSIQAKKPAITIGFGPRSQSYEMSGQLHRGGYATMTFADQYGTVMLQGSFDRTAFRGTISCWRSRRTAVFWTM